MWKDSLILFAAIITGLSSLWITLSEWDNSNYVHIRLGSFRGLATLTLAACFIAVGTLLAIGKCFGKSTRKTIDGVIYQSAVALLFAQSCYVWVTAVTNQRIVNACGTPLTIGAPININKTCIEQCDGTDITQRTVCHF